MKAWQIQRIHPLSEGDEALVAVDVPVPAPGPDEVLIKVSVCAMCHTEHLWMEKEIKSVANITDTDVSEFLKLAAQMKLTPEYQVYPMDDANRALGELKQGKIRGAKALRIQ